MYRKRSLAMILALLGFLLFLPATSDAQKTLSVQVREGQLRSTPSFLGKIIARVVYGDRVAVVEDQGAWKKVTVKGGNLQGWIHESALTSKQIALRAGQSNVKTSATQSEIALAGKGFNEQVETAFRKENKNLNYTWINRMETFKVSPDQMRAFLAQGHLAPSSEGGRP